MIKLVMNEYRKINKYKLILTLLILVGLIYLIAYFNKNNTGAYIFETVYTFTSFLGLFVSILFGGIVSKEVHDGTFRMYLTKPYKRWKIILSKLIIIYVIIFIMYITTIVSYDFIINIYKEFRMTKFDAIKVLYYFAPVVFSGTFCLFLSTVINNTILSVGVSCIITLLSNFISQIFIIKGYKFIGYTFLSYMDLSVLRDNEYISIMKSYGVYLNLKRGVFILGFTALFLIIFSICFFNKKDIKN